MFSAAQKRAQDLIEATMSQNCPWCGEEIIVYPGTAFDVELEGHVQECEVFLQEQGEQ
jgi:hypothetical protein